MNSEVSKYIRSLPASSLKKYFEFTPQEIVSAIEWNKPDKAIKKKITQQIGEVSGPALAKLTEDVQRIASLTDEIGQSILARLVTDAEHPEYSQLINEIDRSLWLFIKDSARFALAREFWHADVNRHSRIWSAYRCAANAAFSEKEEHIEKFKSGILALYHSIGKIRIDIHQRARADSDNHENIFQIVVYREDLPVTRLKFKEEDVVEETVRPVIEISLTYEPKTGDIEVVADGEESRRSIAKIFAESILQSPIPGEKIPLKEYDIQKLLKETVLSFDASDGIEWVKVTQLKVAPYGNYNSITLDIGNKEHRNIYAVSREHFGDKDPLRANFRLIQVRITIKFLPDNESRRGKPLHVKLRDPHGCDLKSKTSKERLIGEKYLARWGLVKTI